MRQRKSKAQEADIGNLSTHCHHVKKRTKTNEKANIHPTNNQVQRIVKDIRSLRDSGKSDIEIRETLGLDSGRIRSIFTISMKKKEHLV